MRNEIRELTTGNPLDQQSTAATVSDELRAEDLERVVGCGITKTTDQASPTFFKNCCNGTHYAAVAR
jgi:type VI protein secretion system component Hcp